MKFIILFEDNPDVDTKIRRKNMPQHLAFLTDHRQQVEAAGPLHEPDGDPAGGLWIVDADSEDTIEALIKADPLWATGLRKSFRVLKWTQVFADGTPLS